MVFDIAFDYRFDTNGFFSDPVRRSLLEAAAAVWESIITDEFTNVPVGTELNVINPQTGEAEVFFADAEIEDVVIFVGSRTLGNDTLARGGPSFRFLPGTELETRWTGADFQPWVGTIAFGVTTNWFFDPTVATADDIPADTYDFFGVALHELGHVLGVGTAEAFTRLVAGGSYIGSNATVLNEGSSIPLSADLEHIEDKFLVDGVKQEALMNPTPEMGTRELATPLDLALLVDIGYQISSTAIQPTLTRNPNQVFVIDGILRQDTQLRFTLTERDANFVNEVGIFVVDDEQGTLNGIAPNQPGYLQAALSQGQVIFSALSDGVFSDLVSTRQLNFNTGSTLAFYLVQNSTTDTVLADLAAGRTPANVFFSVAPDLNNFLQVSELAAGEFSLAWEDLSSAGDGDFNDLRLTVQLQADNSLPLATGLQGNQQGELLDLRDKNPVQASFRVESEATYNNSVGLYRVENEQGTVIDPLTGQQIDPGQVGYAQAALRQRVNLDLSEDTTNLTTLLNSGIILAPYLIADGTPDEFLAGNSNNQPGQAPLAYFAYLGANPDGVDHIRLLGDNTFGFEDAFGGGDFDYNDMVVQIAFA